MRYIVVFIALIVMMALPAAAQEREMLTVDIAQNYVDITTDFEGGPVYVFGMTQQPGDVIIALRGPLKNMTVREKKQVLGAWMNRQSVSFRKVPNFFSIAATKDIEELLPEEALQAHQIDVEHLSYDIVDAEKIKPENQARFKEALLRNKQAQGLYHMTREDITFLNDRFFRATFHLPPNVPVGNFEVQTFFIRGGKIEDIKTNTIRVAQVGLSSRIQEFSKSQSFIYGLLCIMLAVFSGWLSNRIRRPA